MKMPEKARQAYLRGMDADSTFEEVIPETDSNESPLILLHRGPADFVEYALRSLRHCHPQRRIVLITDDYHRYESGLNIEYRQWVKYNSTAKGLAMSYRHQSTNRFAFELLCLERWLVLHEFCEQEQLSA